MYLITGSLKTNYITKSLIIIEYTQQVPKSVSVVTYNIYKQMNSSIFSGLFVLV